MDDLYIGHGGHPGWTQRAPIGDAVLFIFCYESVGVGRYYVIPNPRIRGTVDFEIGKFGCPSVGTDRALFLRQLYTTSEFIDMLIATRGSDRRVKLATD